MMRVKGQREDRPCTSTYKPPEGFPTSLRAYEDLDHLREEELLGVALCSHKTLDGSPLVWSDVPERIRDGRMLLSQLASRQFQAVHNMIKIYEAQFCRDSKSNSKSLAVLTFRCETEGKAPKRLEAEKSRRGETEQEQCTRRTADKVQRARSLLEDGFLTVLLGMIRLNINSYISNTVLKGLKNLMIVELVAVTTVLENPWLPVLLFKFVTEKEHDLYLVQKPAAELLQLCLEIFARIHFNGYLAAFKNSGSTIKTLTERLNFFSKMGRRLTNKSEDKLNEIRELIAALYSCLLILDEDLLATNDCDIQKNLRIWLGSHEGSLVVQQQPVVEHCYSTMCRTVEAELLDRRSYCHSCNMAYYCTTRCFQKECHDFDCLKTLMGYAKQEIELGHFFQIQPRKQKKVTHSMKESFEVPADIELKESEAKFLKIGTAPAKDDCSGIPYEPATKPFDLPCYVLWSKVLREVEKKYKRRMRIDESKPKKYKNNTIRKHTESLAERTILIHLERLCPCEDPINHSFPVIREVPKDPCYYWSPFYQDVFILFVFAIFIAFIGCIFKNQLIGLVFSRGK